MKINLFLIFICYFFYRNADLLASKDFSECDAFVFESLRIDCDTEWDTEFICSCVSLTDGVTRVINLRADTDFIKIDLEVLN